MLEIDIKKGLRDFDLDVKMVIKEGEILMLVGDNGCGKTSLLNLVAGLQDPDEGRIALEGRPLFDSSLKIRVAPEGRNIGYVFQSYALFPHMSVYDNVAFGLRTRRLSRNAVESRVMEHLKAAGLWDIRKARAVEVSGGQRQRVALARALIIEPDLLLLDEPLSALDVRKQAAMRKELRERIHACHVPSIIVTHDLRDVASIGDRACLLERGRIALTGSADEVMGWGEGLQDREGEQSEEL
ncbi:MAG: ABC transporter ATP-binding protein [Methanothrix sp.]|jgi:ABC-type sulfate/molybdate transport systems ATPase subunit|uniref:sulfate/molybdate ABC transporter ATP-binding protein n=1 Tax=Methanothrix sp. TaxID=90426 RepID=UPI003BB70ACC